MDTFAMQRMGNQSPLDKSLQTDAPRIVGEESEDASKKRQVQRQEEVSFAKTIKNILRMRAFKVTWKVAFLPAHPATISTGKTEAHRRA